MVQPKKRDPSDRIAPNIATMGEFWTWAMSDLLVNTNRGLLAEFIVARALGDSTPIRDPWRPYDVIASDGTTVEVKSASYVQSWHQKAPTEIIFQIQPTTAWDPKTSRFVGDRRRQAAVYVLALLAHEDKRTVDPADTTQWRFYVVPTALLDRECGHAKTVSLRRLEKLGVASVSITELRTAVPAASSAIRASHLTRDSG